MVPPTKKRQILCKIRVCVFKDFWVFVAVNYCLFFFNYGFDIPHHQLSSIINRKIQRKKKEKEKRENYGARVLWSSHWLLFHFLFFCYSSTSSPTSLPSPTSLLFIIEPNFIFFHSSMFFFFYYCCFTFVGVSWIWVKLRGIGRGW